MARYKYEFFRPRVGMTMVFPTGVLAQDRGGTVYAAIPELPVPDEADIEFYALDRREDFMNEGFLVRIETTDPETGEPIVLDASDKRLLDVLRRRGSHHFIYGPLKSRQGSAADVAAEEASRLMDKDVRRAAVTDVLDPTTRAALETYV